jgi:hypothetical protein
VNALQTLRKLHDAEESARQRSVERRRVLTTVVLSASVYSNNVERILLSEKPPEDDGITAEVLQRAKEALSAVKAYTPDTTPEEQNLLAHLQASLLEEQDIFRSAKAWNPQEFRGRAQQVVSEAYSPQTTTRCWTTWVWFPRWNGTRERSRGAVRPKWK